MKGNINLAYTSPVKLERDTLAARKEELKKSWEENKKTVNHNDSDNEDDDDDNFIKADQLEEFKMLDTELKNSDLSVIKTNENLRIYEQDIVSI